MHFSSLELIQHNLSTILDQWKNEHAAGAEILADMLAEGTLQHHETFLDGFDNAALAMISLLKGSNTGKFCIRI